MSLSLEAQRDILLGRAVNLGGGSADLQTQNGGIGIGAELSTTGSGSIQMIARGTEGHIDVNRNAPIRTEAGSLRLVADGRIDVQSGSPVSAAGGNIELLASQDQNGDGRLTLASGIQHSSPDGSTGVTLQGGGNSQLDQPITSSGGAVRLQNPDGSWTLASSIQAQSLAVNGSTISLQPAASIRTIDAAAFQADIGDLELFGSLEAGSAQLTASQGDVNLDRANVTAGGLVDIRARDAIALSDDTQLQADSLHLEALDVGINNNTEIAVNHLELINGGRFATDAGTVILAEDVRLRSDQELVLRGLIDANHMRTQSRSLNLEGTLELGLETVVVEGLPADFEFIGTGPLILGDNALIRMHGTSPLRLEYGSVRHAGRILSDGGNVTMRSVGDMNLSGSIEQTTDGGDIDLQSLANLNLGGTVDSLDGQITISATGVSDLDVNSVVRTDSGGSVELTGGRLRVDGLVSTGAGSGGRLMALGGSVLGASPMIGIGDITLRGGDPDLQIFASIENDGDLILEADRDILVGPTATLTTTDGGGLTLRADRDRLVNSDPLSRATGGVWLQGASSASGPVQIQGDDLATHPGTGVRVDAPVQAGQTVFIESAGGVELNAAVENSGSTGLEIYADGLLQIGGDITADGGIILYGAGGVAFDYTAPGKIDTVNGSIALFAVSQGGGESGTISLGSGGGATYLLQAPQGSIFLSGRQIDTVGGQFEAMGISLVADEGMRLSGNGFTAMDLVAEANGELTVASELVADEMVLQAGNIKQESGGLMASRVGLNASRIGAVPVTVSEQFVTESADSGAILNGGASRGGRLTGADLSSDLPLGTSSRPPVRVARAAADEPGTSPPLPLPIPTPDTTPTFDSEPEQEVALDGPEPEEAELPPILIRENPSSASGQGMNTARVQLPKDGMFDVNVPLRLQVAPELRRFVQQVQDTVIRDVPGAEVKAIQFAEFYFLHRYMQVSKFSMDLDLNFIDFLVFGRAGINADASLPKEAKRTIYLGGVKPFLL